MNTEQLNNFSSAAGNQNPASVQQDSIKQGLASDIKTIENLVQQGVMTQELGLNLMEYVSQKAYEKYISGQAQPKQEDFTPQPKEDVPPEFFNRDGRLDVYTYLKNTDANFDEDEISKISALVEKIENTAIERYLKEKDHEKTLNSENESAKQRLRANAQNGAMNGTTNMVFTREQIGKMTGAEFAKHERAIMDQLKKGLIK